MPTTSQSDLLARMLVQKGDFSIKKRIVKPRAFMPGFDQGAWVTSVFDIDGLNDVEIWEVGRVHVAVPRRKTLYGHAGISRNTIEDQSLLIERKEPPVGHCNIAGWPSAKEEQISLAQELAAGSQLKLSPEPIKPDSPVTPPEDSE